MSELTSSRKTGFGAAANFSLGIPAKDEPRGNSVPADEGERPAVELDAAEGKVDERLVTRDAAATTYTSFRTVVGNDPKLLLGKDLKRKRVVIFYEDAGPANNLMIGNRASLNGLDGFLVPTGTQFEAFVTDETYIVCTETSAVQTVYVWVETYA